MTDQILIWQQLTTCLTGLLDKHGLSIVHPFSVQHFNSQGCPTEHQLPTFDRGGSLGLVIGNTNRLWPHFVQDLVAHPDALYAENPLDAYIEAVVSQAVQQSWQTVMPGQQSRQQCLDCAQQGSQQHDMPCHHQELSDHHDQSSSQSTTQPPGSCDYVIRFSHHTEPGRFVNMMRAAQISGLAYYSSTTHLCMHPVYGPWFALRAVAVFDIDGPDPGGFKQLPCPYPDVEAEAADKMKQLEFLGGFSNWQQHWRDWAALRALGAKHTDPRYAYSADQLEYHYTKSKEVLKRAMSAQRSLQQQQQGASQTESACERLVT